ncbi:ATP-binding protein [Aquibacillus rhizosphaerae]|uniref:histidine kinase n=1 Tax=Aquibacillus rhizosphaerae TaxID=3051431 RepID=A0ABT7LA22_9BACI|nr:ATP-binding protein [Aquibacillus sp. LR5S19]MDL4842708.1 ATP-binding protein [Aquibacillus sp. LR5S19]
MNNIVLRRIYLYSISIIGCVVFLLHNPISIFFQVTDNFSSVLLILFVVSILISYRFQILVPPDGNSFSLDSSIFLAITFIYGLEISLFVLFVGSVIYDLRQQKALWRAQIFNFAMYTLMISGAYYVFIYTAGEIGQINFSSTYSYILALGCYYVINIILVGLGFLIASSNRLLPLLKKTFQETIIDYIIIFALVFILGLVLETSPIFGIIAFTFLIVVLSIFFKKYFRLFEKVSNDKKNREQMMDSLPIGIITLEEEAFDIRINSFAVKLLNIEPDEIKKILVSENKVQIKNKEFWNIFQTKQIVENVRVVYKTEKKTYRLLVSQSELTNHSFVTIGRIYHFIDMTDLEELQKRIYQSEKLALLGELSAGAAHEIRNPLTVIQGFLTLMTESFSKSEQNKFHIPFMLSEFERIDSIVEEMLMLAKPGEPKLMEAYIKDIIEEIVPHYTNSTAQEIEFNINLDDTRLLLDEKQMKQVMYNLIRNSCDAIGSKGKISIYSKINEDTYQLFIEDTGSGIPLELQESIYSPFLTNKDSGTGLGLTIVQKMIENQNGDIKLYSTSENGTTFLITLPLPKE